MKLLLKNFLIKLILLLSFFSFTHSFADNHNIYEILENIQKDIKTLEKAVYSGSNEFNSSISNNSDLNLDNNSEDVLTRHF